MQKIKMYLLVLFGFLLCLFPFTQASLGDRSSIYQTCLKQCYTLSCSSNEAKANFTSQQAWYLRAFFWDCNSECRHSCMWETVTVLEERGSPIPQFHGKWPFLRLMGIQEPASVLFSLLNCYYHYRMWMFFKKKIPKSAPNYWLWQAQALLSINAWIWSAVFHTRDTALTEKMDYFCAFSLVLYGLYCLSIRTLGTSKNHFSIPIAIPFLSYFLYHIYFLSFIRFDYGYNMKANILVGLVSSFGWLVWCFRNRHQKYVSKCAVCILGINCLLLLEVCDFPPWAYVLDSHSLWHLGTVPMPILWYRFLIEDTRHLMEKTGYMNGSEYERIKLL